MSSNALGRMFRFMKRHGANSPRMAALALLRTCYRRESVRGLVRPFVSPRRPEKWIFLVGCYNSGTTVTQDILAAHPAVATLPWEGALITSVLPNPEDCGWTRMWLHCQDHMEMPPGDHPELVDRVLRDWALWWNRQAPVFLEKSITNVTRMAWLDRHFENAYFVGIVRNGYCAAEGIRRKAALRPRRAAQWGGTYPIEMAGQQWVVANESLLAGASQVQRYMQLKYENLIADPVNELRSVWEFLGLPVPDAHCDSGQLTVAGHAIRLAADTNAGSLARLSGEDIAKLNAVLGEMQQRLGYEVLVERP